MKARAVAVVAAAMAGGLVACQLIAGIERVEKDPPPAKDAAQEAGTGDPCTHALPPPPPAKDDDPGGAVPPFYLAVRVFGVAQPVSGGVSGFDLDGVCTCDLQPGAAHGGASSCTPKSTDCDGEGGADNQATKLFGTFEPVFSFDTIINSDVDRGARTLLFYVTGYNGRANDQTVTVGAMLTNGILDGSGCGTAVNPETGLAPPGWCGNDLWTYAGDAVKAGTREPAGTGDAYVTDGTLVFASDLPLAMYLGSGAIAIGSPKLGGKLAKNAAGHWTLDGTVAGRMVAADLLELLGNYDTRADDGGSGLCQQSFFPTAKTTICAEVDIARLSRFDFQGGPCDALSIAIGFKAEQAAIGAQRDATKTDGPCAAARQPSGTYACP